MEPPAGSAAELGPAHPVSVGSASRRGPSDWRTAAGLGAELAQHRRDHAALLLEQDGEQVLGGGLRVAALVGQPLGGLQRLLGLDGEAVWLHRRFRVSE